MKDCPFFNQDFINHIWPYFYNNAILSIKTKENIWSALSKLASFCGKDPLTIKKKDAQDFMDYLFEKSNSNSDVRYSHSYISILYKQLRAFYKFLGESKTYFEAAYDLKLLPDPFAEVYCEFLPQEPLSIDSIPTFADIDKLLSSSNSITLSLAIKLSMKLGLTASEIISLKRNSFIRNEDQFYLEFVNTYHGQENKRILHVPNDVMKQVDDILHTLPDNMEYIVPNYVVSSTGDRRLKPYTLRTLQRHLSQCCLAASVNSITFSDLRNFFIYHAKEAGCPDNVIASYTGQEGRWVYRVEVVPREYTYDAADYLNFYFR